MTSCQLKRLFESKHFSLQNWLGGPGRDNIVQWTVFLLLFEDKVQDKHHAFIGIKIIVQCLWKTLIITTGWCLSVPLLCVFVLAFLVSLYDETIEVATANVLLSKDVELVSPVSDFRGIYRYRSYHFIQHRTFVTVKIARAIIITIPIHLQQ